LQNISEEKLRIPDGAKGAGNALFMGKICGVGMKFFL
jgi:hypothetical protein